MESLSEIGQSGETNPTRKREGGKMYTGLQSTLARKILNLDSYIFPEIAFVK